MKKFKWLTVGGFVFILAVSVIMFAATTEKMDKETDKDIESVANTYIEGIANEELYHFNSIAEIRFKQIEYIRHGMEQMGDLNNADEVYKNLEFFGELQQIPTLALIDGEGNYETVYGADLVSIDNPEFIRQNLSRGLLATTGANNHDQQLILWCMPLHYPMKSGAVSAGIICSRPMDLFVEKLNLNSDGTLAFFHLIRRDGTYVVQNEDSVGNTFFDKLEMYAHGVHRPTPDIVSDFKKAIEKGENCSWVVDYDDKNSGVTGRRTSMAFPLPDSDWYIVAIMPYHSLDAMVTNMSDARERTMYINIAIIVLCILIVFFLYMKLSRKQMKLLQNALDTAEKATAEAHRARGEAEIAREKAMAANKSKSEFLSNMSHDIRTPMNAIVGMTQIATEHIDDKERVQDCLKKISLSGSQLLGLINDVLDMSKIESGKMTLKLEALSLKNTMGLVCDIVRPQIKANGQHFEIIINDIIAEEVYCDSVRLNQVLLNLLSNAMKFTPKDGSIKIELRQEKSTKGDEYVRTHLSVKDTGMGMSEEFQKKLFTAFEREDNLRVQKTQGTGLGLTITKHIVDAMEGTIDVQSEVGVGTTFHVAIDFEKVQVSLKEMKLPPWRILVVDNSEEICGSAKLALSELGTRPDTCTNGKEAVQLAVDAEVQNDAYFVILVDYKMDEMSGVETAKAIRERVGEHIPIILISAYDWADIEEDAKTAGIKSFISKPLFKSTLYHELHKFAEGNSNDTADDDLNKTINLKGMKILLAEDNDINAEIATVILEEDGCIVDRADDGKIATELFSKSEEGYYDAILMDLRMPNMNGIEATETIRAMKRTDSKTIPIIATTADAFDEDAQKCMAAGMNAHLAKPIDVDQLKRTLAMLVNQNRNDI